MTLLKLGIGLALLSLGLAATGQYKIIGPDGKVTYTDQPPADNLSKVQSMRSGSGQPDLVLPYATGQAARNFPVVLYTQEGCAPCDSGRTLLRARGIPYEEKTISSQADLDGLKAINRDGQLPLLTVGREQIAGYEAGRWNGSLSTAGYPANATLPGGYAPKKGPLVPEPVAKAATTTPAPVANTAPTTINANTESNTGFKFQK